MKKIKFIDLFAGLGGFRTAIEELSRKKNFSTECVFVSEINEKAIQTYQHNFSTTENIINIRDIDDKCSNVPNHDFLFAGFPCQTFSNAGNKRGFLDEIRGTLFFEIVKILVNKKPKYALLENVKHIINHDNGRTWKIITSKLEEIGYIIPKNPLILNPIDFGIPQDRRRVFIPMILREKSGITDKHLELNFSSLFDNTFKRTNNYELSKKEIFENYLEKEIDKKYLLSFSETGKYLEKTFKAWGSFRKNVKTRNNKTLPVIWLDFLNIRVKTDDMPIWKKKYLNDMWIIYDDNKKFIDNWLVKNNVSSWKKRERKFEWQAGSDISDIKETFIQLRQSGIRCRRPISFPTLVAMVQIPIIFDNKNWRYLSPRETAKLQSYPNDYKLFNEIDNENTQKDFHSYMQIGNSVNVKVVEIIQEKLLGL